MAANATVILVEDDKDVRDAVRRALRKSHHRLLFDTSNLDDAEIRLGRLKVRPDVALIDRSFFETRGESEPSSRAGFLFNSSVADMFPDTTRVFFSNYDEQDFGMVRFPEGNQYKTPKVIERDLGTFINGLSPAARR